jgi:hypothetical protein
MGASHDEHTACCSTPHPAAPCACACADAPPLPHIWKYVLQVVASVTALSSTHVHTACCVAPARVSWGVCV